jgi:glycine/D-amino acid oxidase-like deaminating enzyme
MHSPATGRILADLILRGRTEAFDITTLRPERFVDGTFLQETAIL